LNANQPSIPPNITIQQVLLHTEKLLRKRNFASPEAEANLLLAHLLSLPRLGDLALHLQDGLSAQESDRLSSMLAERLSGKPLQLIVGQVGFHNVNLIVKEGVFIPRPETETLVEVGIDFLKNFPTTTHPQILDLGTGCGAVIIALAKASGNGGAGTDISPQAISLARENAERNRLADILKFYTGDLYSPLHSTQQKYHLIVSNPPYIPCERIPYLPTEVCDYDPIQSLDGGQDGLAVIRRIVALAPEHLVAGGLLALEIGEEQGKMVSEILSEVEFQQITITNDLTGKARVVRGTLGD